MQKGHIDSYYAKTARSLQCWAPLDTSRRCDVCVIGGGLTGLAAALRLAEAGINVVLLEKQRMGWAASGRNGGFVSPGFAQSIFAVERRLGIEHARELYRVSVEGVAAIRNLIRINSRDDIIGGRGWLKMIRHGRVDEMERQAERMVRDYGAAMEFVDRFGLAEYVTTDRYRAGLLDMEPFHIHPLEFVGLVAQQAARAGASLYENSRVTSVRRQSGQWQVRSNRVNVAAEHIVLATSAYGGPSRRLNGAILPVATYVVTAQSRQGKLGSAIRFEGCIGDTRRASDYYRLVGPDNDRQLLWGGRITTRQSEPAGLSVGLLRDIRSVYPQLDDLELRHAWSGLMAYAVHKMPILGSLDSGLWAATALGGHGLNTAMMAGELIAEAICGRGDRIRLFEPFGAVWAGGPVGQMAIQAEYWRLRLMDGLAERRAGA
jgi:gamma-glutamylputrescine oxidase